MLDALARIFVNTLYLVPLQVKRFQEKFPEARVLAAGATKARKMRVDSAPQYDAGWAIARRGILILTTTGLYCGDWTIPLDSIREATLLLITGGSLLKVSTSDGAHYQFGLQRDPAWEKQTALPMNVHHGELKFSAFSLIVRLLLVVWLAWSLSQDFVQQSLDFYTGVKALLLIWLLLPFLVGRLKPKQG